MASSKTVICNMALSHLGISQEIANFDSERSKEASAMRRFYDETRKEVLRDFPWPFATKTVDLGLIEESPTDEWDFSYRYPSDCLRARRIPSGIRNDTRQSRVPYRVLQDNSGKLIYTDTEDAQLEYTVNEERVEMFPPDFVLALSLLLAAYTAPRLTGGDPFKLGNRALQLYDIQRNKAEANAVNEESDEEQPDSELERARL